MLIVGVENMLDLADKVARMAQVNDCIALRGDLGAGKTTFVQQFVNVLSDEVIGVISPTFNLLQTYDVMLFSGEKTTLWHYDLYRLEDVSEMEELGLEDALETGLTMIEWPELVMAWLPEGRIDMIIDFGEVEHNRKVTFEGKGDTLERLKQAGLC